MTQSLPLTDASIAATAAMMEAVGSHPGSTLERAAKFAGYGGTTAKRAVANLKALAILEEKSDGTLACLVPHVRRGMTEDARREVLKRALLGNRPFEALCEGLNLGESLADAWRKGCVLLGIEWDNSKLDLLVKWGLDLGVLIGPPSSPALAIEFQRQPDSSVSPIPAAAFEAEARARLFNSEAIGRSANNALDENDRGLLAAAVLALPTDPPTTVEKAGQAVENFLREISKTRGFDDDAKKCNGAGQLASMLVGKGVLHSHHVKLVDAVGTLRNAKAHDKDKKSLVPWQITRTGASASLLMAHASIKGIHEYITSGGQTI